MHRVIRCAITATCLASAAAFQAPVIPHRQASLVSALRAGRPANSPAVRPCKINLRMAEIKESTLDHPGERAVEEEERRIGLWKTKFALTEQEVDALRSTFEKMLASTSGGTRALGKAHMKRVIETTQASIDAVDIGNEGRPAVQPTELAAYITALGPLWADTCDTDAVEIANGECQVPLDGELFDLSQTLAIFGMCLREHCGIGGVCFWDTPSTPQDAGNKW